MRNRFKKALLFLQNIDDRFLVEWDSIRIITKNEKKINDYLLMKNIKNTEYKNMISLNLNENGLSIIGDEYKNKDSSNQQKSNIDNMFNNNEDKYKTSLEISKGNSIENIYSKDINLKRYNNPPHFGNIEDFDRYKLNNNFPSYFKNSFENRLNDYPIKVDYDFNRENQYGNSYITFNEKLSKILKDPTILKLEEYIKKFQNNNILKKISTDYEQKKENEEELEENLETKLIKSRNNLLKKYGSEKNEELDIPFRFKQKTIKDDKSNFLDKNFLDGNSRNNMKENNQTILTNTKESSSSISTLDKDKPEEIFYKNFISENIKYCFNKQYFSKEFNITGEWDFLQCYNLVEELNKNNVNALNKIDKLNKVLANLKYIEEDIDLDEYLNGTHLYKNEKSLPNETTNIVDTNQLSIINKEHKTRLNNFTSGKEENKIIQEINQNPNHRHIHKVI